jgi:hypothetical protein
LQDEVLAPGLCRLRASLLAHIADLPAHLPGVAQQVIATDLCAPAGGWEQGRQHAHRGRLAGAIGAEEAKDFALVDAEVDAAHRLNGPLPRFEGLG